MSKRELIAPKATTDSFAATKRGGSPSRTMWASPSPRTASASRKTSKPGHCGKVDRRKTK